MIWFMNKLIPFSEAGEVKISASLSRTSSLIQCVFEVSGAIDEILWPVKAPSSCRRDELWKTTCFELFFGEPGANKYFEANFSPSGNWALYSFDDYRSGMKNETSIKIEISEFRISSESAEFRVSLALIDSALAGRDLEASPTAGIENKSGAISYWAMKHASDKPDFHDRASFIVKV
jgi:hypothetical protein